MSKLHQIETALKEIDPAGFQTLCDDYLHRLGRGQINRIGSAVGRKKTAKGTPDTYFTRPNGKFIFAEYTTETKNLFDKLGKDIAKCLDEDKIGIPISLIEEIILCHNGKISIEERVSLANICGSQGVTLSVFGLDHLALDLNSKHRYLAKEHLGIELDTGQILQPTDFVEEYEKSQLATPLSTRFRFREDEIKEALSALKQEDILIVVGRPGVGKSRFGLECGRRFIAKNKSYKFYCVLNKYVPLYDNLQAYFPPVGNYLIMVDDANRVAETEHIFRLLNNNHSGHKIKIIVTVRDYAVDKIREWAKPYAKQKEISLEPFDEKQISEILKSEYNIHHPVFVEHIWRISGGNPRIALMAAKVVKEKNTLGSIADVSVIYDEYFSSILVDLADLKNKELLQAAGIISLYRCLDRTAHEVFDLVANSFGISASRLWDNIVSLHDMEVVDLHDNNVARISDQVLATYLFYKAFFRDEVLDFSVVMNQFLNDKHSSFTEYRMKDALYPILGAFDRKLIKERLRKDIDQNWASIQSDEPKILKFLDVFWFLKQTQTLFYFKERIDSMNARSVPVETIRFAADTNSVKDPYLNILGYFDQAETDGFEIAVDLILLYIEKCPDLTPQALRLFVENFSFEPNSHYSSYRIQQILIEKLIKKSTESKYCGFFDHLLLASSKHFLRMRFKKHWSENRGARLAWCEFDLLPNKTVLEIRKALWDSIVGLYAIPSFHGTILELISNYSQNREVVKEIAEQESKWLLQFMLDALNPDSYLHCVIVQDYLKFLELNGITFKKSLKTKFSNDTYKVSLVLHNQRRNLKMNLSTSEALRKNILNSHFAKFSFEDYKLLLRQCQEIANVSIRNHDWFSIRYSLKLVLKNLSESNPMLFRQVIEWILQNGNDLGIVESNIVYCLLSCYKNDRAAYNLLKKYNYQSKDTCLLNFIAFIGHRKVSKFYLVEFFRLIETSNLTELPLQFDFLEPYEVVDKKVIPQAVRAIYTRIRSENSIFNGIDLFDSQSQTAQRLSVLFRDDVALIEAIYLNQSDPHSADYNSESFIKILGLDSDFIYKYIDWMYEHHEHLSHYYDHRNFNFLWLIDNFQQIMLRVIEHIFSKQESEFWFDDYLSVFFVRHADEIDPLAESRKIEVLIQYIEIHYADRSRMRFLFQLVVEYLADRMLELLSVFCAKNQRFEDFENLPLEPRFMSGTGSFVPAYEARIRFLESLLPSLSNNLNLLRHKIYIEEQIESWKLRINEENRRRFIEAAR